MLIKSKRIASGEGHIGSVAPDPERFMIGKISRKALDVVQAPKPVRKGTGELRTGAFDTPTPSGNDSLLLTEDLAGDSF
jgi:hypothetical protein